MIVVKIFAGIVVILTLVLAVFSQFYVINLPADHQLTAANPQIAVAPPTLDVRRHAGAVNCKFEPVTDSPQQFAADYLFGELFRQGDRHLFTARVAVPTGGYSGTFGPISLAGTQAIVEARLVKSNGPTLEMIDSIGLQQSFLIPQEALTLRVILRRNFAWGPDAIICSVVRPALPAAPAPVAPAPVAPATP